MSLPPEKNLIPDISKTVDKIYDDLASPAVKQVGKLIELPFRTINNMLQSAEIWNLSKEQQTKMFKEDLHQELNNRKVKNSNLVEPDPFIYYHSQLNYMLSVDKRHLKELFVKLLASSMEKDKHDFVMPSFINIVKQFNSDEARIVDYLKKELFKEVSTSSTNAQLDLPIMKIIRVDDKKSYSVVYNHLTDVGLLSNCRNKLITSTYISDLERLGLIDTNYLTTIADKSLYDRVQSNLCLDAIIDNLPKDDHSTYNYMKGAMSTTQYFYSLAKVL